MLKTPRDECLGEFLFCGRGLKLGFQFINSLYAERPEGSRKSSLFVVQTLRQAQGNAFGTVRNISY